MNDDVIYNNMVRSVQRTVFKTKLTRFSDNSEALNIISNIKAKYKQW